MSGLGWIVGQKSHFLVNTAGRVCNFNHIICNFNHIINVITK